MKTNKLVLILAIAALIGGFVLIMNSKLIGVLLILAAFGIGAFSVMKARNAAGYDSRKADGRRKCCCSCYDAYSKRAFCG